jgi:signal transduction histidine kinase
VLPYAALLTLYLLVLGGGGAWMYLQVRAAESRVVMEELAAALEPVVGALASRDALRLTEDTDSWITAEVKALFGTLPSLREVLMRSLERGWVMRVARTGTLVTQSTSPLTPGTSRDDSFRRAAERLHAEPEAIFHLGFDLAPAGEPPVRVDFGFSRSELLGRVGQGMASLEHAILLFGVVGGASILVAMAIAVFAVRTTRRVEGHFQEIYLRASATEVAAALVHDLRNPLMALRANVKALLVSPQQTQEIVAELDRDIVTLNDKLNGFLKLTRSHDAVFAPTDLKGLIEDAVRLARPALAQPGLAVELDVPPGLPSPELQAPALRDALLNVIINAAQSGQKAGSVCVSARLVDGGVSIAVEDRGAGIAAADLPRLFDAFYTTKPDGNGLGLAIVQRIIEAHHGQVLAENRPEGGARITLVLPLAQPEIPRWWKAKKISSRI